MSDIISEIKAKLTPIFSAEHSIAAAYLFGSSASGQTHQMSDIDLAVLYALDKRITLDGILNIEVKITLALGTENFDLVVANSSSLILKFRIISTGKLIYNASDDVRCEFEEKVMQDYYDFLPRLNEFNREYFNALKEEYLR